MSGIRPPRRLKVRPHWKGLPIPYIALIRPDGTPDFRVTDEARRLHVIRYRLCQLCGDQLGRWFFFVGGTQAAEANAYFEPAAHLDCLIYAMQVCPFIAGRIEHVPLEKVQEQYAQPIGRAVTTGEGASIIIKDVDNILAARNPWWVIKKADGWTHGKTKGGTILLVPDVIKATEPLCPEKMAVGEWKIVMQELMK